MCVCELPGDGTNVGLWSPQGLGFEGRRLIGANASLSLCKCAARFPLIL